MAVVKISELPTMGTVANNDILPIVDVSETETKKITKENLLTDIPAGELDLSNVTETTQINNADYLLISQGGTTKKIKKENTQFASGDEVVVSTTTPVDPDNELKLWVNPDEMVELLPVGHQDYLQQEIYLGTKWCYDNKPMYRYCYVFTGFGGSTGGRILGETHRLPVENVSNICRYECYGLKPDNQSTNNDYSWVNMEGHKSDRDIEVRRETLVDTQAIAHKKIAMDIIPKSLTYDDYTYGVLIVEYTKYN